MLVTDGTVATRQAQVLFEFLDQVTPIEYPPYPRIPGKESHDRILQTFIAIGKHMKPPAEQLVMERKRQHEPQHLPEAAAAEGKVLRALLDARYGEPPLGDSTEIFVRAVQLSLGGEWETELRGVSPWIKPYFALSLGWRREQLRGDEEFGGVQSENVDRPVVVGDMGARFDMAENRRTWHLQLQLGLSGWLPFDVAQVSFQNRFFMHPETRYRRRFRLHIFFLISSKAASSSP
jgi:hypothetical protein